MPSCYLRAGTQQNPGGTITPILKPDGEHAEKVLARLSEGEVIKVEFRRGRSVQHHRKFFAILSTVIENTDKWPNTTALLDALKIAMGHVDQIINIDGSVSFKPKSIDFTRMAQDEFNTFFDGAMDLICTKILPGVDRDALIGESR